MNKNAILTVAGIAAAIAAGGVAATTYMHNAQERHRDAMQQVFSTELSAYDTDGNKFMSKAELESFARNTYRKMVRGDETPEQQDRKEFAALFTLNSKSQESPKIMEQEAYSTFDYADLNKDSILNEEEYTAFYMYGLTKMGWPELETKGIPLLDGPRAPAGD